MSTVQYESLVKQLTELADQKEKIQREQERTAGVGGKKKRAARGAEATVVDTMEVKVNKTRTISLWANTAGVSRNTGHANNVDIAASDEEIDPLKGIEVTDPYAL